MEAGELAQRWAEHRGCAQEMPGWAPVLHVPGSAPSADGQAGSLEFPLLGWAAHGTQDPGACRELGWGQNTARANPGGCPLYAAGLLEAPAGGLKAASCPHPTQDVSVASWGWLQG